MAINNFVAAGGDGYPALNQHPGYVDTGFVDADVLRAAKAALAQQAEPAVPIATLHDDGCYTWTKGKCPPEGSQFAGWRMQVYGAPPTPPAEPSPAPDADRVFWPIHWPTMPTIPGSCPAVFAGGYASGWAKCMAGCQAAVEQAWPAPDAAPPAPVGEPTPAQIEFVARWLSTILGTDPDKLLDVSPDKFAWQRHDMQARTLLRQAFALSAPTPSTTPQEAEGLTADDLWASEEVMAVNAEAGLGMGLLLRLGRAIESASLAKVKPS